MSVSVAASVIVNGCLHEPGQECEFGWVAVIWDTEDPFVASVCVCVCARMGVGMYTLKCVLGEKSLAPKLTQHLSLPPPASQLRV